jgi:signal transduction histidine kinase
MLEHIVEEYRVSAPSHEIRWTPPAAPATVDGDELRIAEVLANLLDNAVKYTPARGRIDVGLAVAGGRAEVTIADTGIGIPAEDLPRIFERFRRGRNVAARQYGGLGIGLFISREIVRLHGGDLRVESEEGKGTRVTLRLPAIDGDRPEADRGSPPA